MFTRSRLLHNLRQLLLWLVAAITAGFFLIISTALVFLLLFSGQKSDKTIVFVNQIQNEEINPIIITQLSYSPPKAAVVWGSWSVRLPNASQLLADSPKAELLRTRSTLSFSLQQSIDRVVVVPGLFEPHSKTNLVTMALRSLVSLYATDHRGANFFQTFPIFWQRLSILHDLWSLPSDRWQFLTSNSAEEWTKLQQTITPLAPRDCSVTVVNTTAEPGLASTVGKLLERSGLYVARVTDTDTNLERSLIIHDGRETCSTVIQHVGALIPEATKPQRAPERTTEYRGNVVLLVGQDVARILWLFVSRFDVLQ